MVVVVVVCGIFLMDFSGAGADGDGAENRHLLPIPPAGLLAPFFLLLWKLGRECGGDAMEMGVELASWIAQSRNQSLRQ